MDKFLLLTVGGIVIVVTILVFVLIVMTLKEKNSKSNTTGTKKEEDEIESTRAKKSIFKFMEFDTVEDNMIVQDGGKRYLMVIECKGINYDLLSGVEKNAVEQGFIGFLNALKFEVQLYVQTRKVNLAQSTAKYRERLRAIEMDMIEEEQRYQNLVRSNNATSEEILKELKEVTKKRNLYEYGKDIIENTEQMSEDSDLTRKEYYIVVPYYTDEITSAGDYDKREIGSMAFSELYTRAQSLVSALTECDVRGRILTSKEIIELLFISYNREQHDTYDFSEYIENSGYDSFYSVSPDVLQKRIEALDEEIERKAKDKAIEAYRRVNRKTEMRIRAIKEREARMDEYVNNLAREAINSQANAMGRAVAQESIEELEIMDKEREEFIKAREERNKKQGQQEDEDILELDETEENNVSKKQDIEEDEFEDIDFEETEPTNSKEVDDFEDIDFEETEITNKEDDEEFDVDDFEEDNSNNEQDIIDIEENNQEDEFDVIDMEDDNAEDEIELIDTEEDNSDEDLDVIGIEDNSDEKPDVIDMEENNSDEELDVIAIEDNSDDELKVEESNSEDEFDELDVKEIAVEEVDKEKEEAEKKAEAARKAKAKRISELSHEEKVKLAKKLKQKKMLKEMEAKKNGEN